MRWKSIWKLSRRKEVRVLKYCHIYPGQEPSVSAEPKRTMEGE